MKTRYFFIIILCLGMIILDSCNKESEDNTTANATLSMKSTPYTKGQVLTYSFVAGNDTMVKMTDEVKDFGFTNFPVLMLVHKETLIKEPGWGSVFFPVVKAKLDTILNLWAKETNMNNLTAIERAYVARHFLDFIVKNNIDAGLFIEILLGSYRFKLSSVQEVISEVKNLGKEPNDYMFRMWSENIPPEKLLSELKSTKQAFIASIFIGIAIQFETWYQFAKNSGPVSNAPQCYASFLCSEDTVLAHYTGGTTFRSNDYKLSYDAGLWEAKCTYHVEGEYNDVNPTGCPGKYIKKCNVISTYVHVKGPDFIVDGSAGYSPAINMGTDIVPVAEMNGKVKVTYGDCCCFRKFSYLNYKINAETGYKQMTFDPGK